MKFIILLFIFFNNINLSSQDRIGIVQYGHKQSMGMGAPIGIDYNAFLIFNNNNAKYTFAKDSLEGGRIKEYVTIEKDRENIFVKPKNTSESGFQYYTNRNNQKSLSRDIGFIYVKEDIPKIKWKISNDKKNIGNFECIKATGIFRGRKYTAWFTKSIPLPYGPWKLQGLPGLILEAYDTNKEVFFYFKSIKYPFYSVTRIKRPNPISEQKDWISFHEYKMTLIKKHRTAIENGRIMTERFNTATSDENKNTMRNSYIEIFDDN